VGTGGNGQLHYRRRKLVITKGIATKIGLQSYPELSNGMKRLSWVVVLGMAVSLGCSTPKPNPQGEAAACREVQKMLDKTEDALVNRVKEIRGRRILLVEYDREMIAALTAYRDGMRSILDGDEAVSGTRWHCAGKPLADLRLNQQPKLDRVQGYVLTFQKAVEQDPKDVYVP
jgi:hypothetical protein